MGINTDNYTFKIKCTSLSEDSLKFFKSLTFQTFTRAIAKLLIRMETIKTKYFDCQKCFGLMENVMKLSGVIYHHAVQRFTIGGVLILMLTF